MTKTRTETDAFGPIVKDPILLTAIAAILLNALLGQSRAQPEAERSGSGIGASEPEIAASSRSSRS